MPGRQALYAWVLSTHMKTYGLLGQNITYSLSPSMHNAAFKALKIEAEYRIFDIPENELDTFFSDFKKGSIEGCNVTIPYKEKAVRYVDECDKLAKSIGAINTIGKQKGRLSGYNTDYQGFLESLKGRNKGDLNFNPRGKDIFIFGAGGAARAVLNCLVNLGARRIVIADLVEEKAEELASASTGKEGMNSVIAVAKEREKYEEFISKSDLLVNATPCGMKENDDELFDYRYIHDKLYVFDLIYARKTRLVEEALSRGCKAINGLNMLLYQAGASSTIWTGRPAPLNAMREALLMEIGQ